MFKCHFCKKTVKPNTSPIKIVLETRTKTYQNVIRLEKGSKTINSTGHETVKEVDSCPDCLRDYS